MEIITNVTKNEFSISITDEAVIVKRYGVFHTIPMAKIEKDIEYSYFNGCVKFTMKYNFFKGNVLNVHFIT